MQSDFIPERCTDGKGKGEISEAASLEKEDAKGDDEKYAKG
jgi:hypothetical protein